MKAADLGNASHLVHQRRMALDHLQTLNAINGGKHMQFPTEVILYLDREALVKGCIPLVVKHIADLERQLAELGVEL